MTETEPRVPAQARSSEPAQGHDVFVSYSRTDREAVVALVAGLEAKSLKAWVDLEDIPPSAEWMAEIRAAIEASDGYLVAVSPSLVSSEVCGEELELARRAGKRIVPVMVRPTDPGSVPGALAALNWIDATDGALDGALDRAVEALRTDLDHVRAHTKLGVRAAEWERKDDTKALLLRGGEIVEAEAVVASGSEPRATPAQARYVQASRAAATRRQRSAIGAVAAALVVSLALSAFALVQRGEAVEQRDRAESQTQVANSRALASEALLSMDDRLDVGMLLALEAYRTAPTPEALDALHVAAQRSIWIEHTLRGPNGVNSAAVAPDGSIIAASDNDGQISIWSAESGKPTGESIDADDRSVFSMAFAADGTLASGGTDGSVDLWDPTTGEAIGEPLPVDDGDVTSVAFSLDGRIVLGGTSEGTVHAWNAGSGTPIMRAPIRVGRQPVWGLAFAGNNDDIIASTEGGLMSSWDLKTGQKVSTFELSAEEAWGLDVSPDGRSVAVATLARRSQAATGEVLVFDLGTGERLWQLQGHDDAAYDVAFSPDGRTLASGSADTTVRLWDVDTGEQVSQPLRAHTDWVNGLAFTPDGGSVISGSSDSTVVVWDVKHRLAGGGGPVNVVTFHPDGESFASTYPIEYLDGGGVTTGRVTVWDTGTLEAIATFDEQGAYGVAYSPDGETLVGTALDPAAFQSDLRRWNSLALEILEPTQAPGPFLTGVAISPDGSTVATGSLEGDVQLWNAESGEPIGELVPGQKGFIYALAFSPDGSILATSSLNGTVVFRDPSDGSVVGEPVLKQRSAVYAMAFDPSGERLAIGNFRGDVVVLSVESREPEFELTLGDGVQSVAFSPDGNVLAAGTVAGEVALFEASTGEVIGDRLPEQRDWVNSLAFDPEGTSLVAASDDGSILVLPSVAWSDDVELLAEHLCSAAGRNLTEAEWKDLIPFAQYRATC